MSARFLTNCLLIVAAASCSSAASKPGEPMQNEKLSGILPGNVHALKQLRFSSLRFRRPRGEGANPKAGPGGVDYKSDPLPDSSYDCERPAQAFARIDVKRLSACLRSIQGPSHVLYRVRREPVPALVLDVSEPESVPACLREVAPELPLPRELVFQSDSGGELECYSSRLDIDADVLMGFKLSPLRKLAVRIDFPFAPPPGEDPVQTLTTWAIAPFWHENRGQGDALLSKLVPEAICRQCLGEKSMIRATDPPAPGWPPLTPPNP